MKTSYLISNICYLTTSTGTATWSVMNEDVLVMNEHIVHPTIHKGKQNITINRPAVIIIFYWKTPHSVDTCVGSH